MGHCKKVLYSVFANASLINSIGSKQKRPGAKGPPEFVPESPLQKGVFGSHIFSKEL